jgi:hypothetical protein
VGRGQCRTRTGEASLICPHSVPAGVPGLGGDSSSPWRIYPSLMPGGRRSRGLALPPPRPLLIRSELDSSTRGPLLVFLWFIGKSGTFLPCRLRN